MPIELTQSAITLAPRHNERHAHEDLIAGRMLRDLASFEGHKFGTHEAGEASGCTAGTMARGTSPLRAPRCYYFMMPARARVVVGRAKNANRIELRPAPEPPNA